MISVLLLCTPTHVQKPDLLLRWTLPLPSPSISQSLAVLGGARARLHAPSWMSITMRAHPGGSGQGFQPYPDTQEGSPAGSATVCSTRRSILAMAATALARICSQLGARETSWSKTPTACGNPTAPHTPQDQHRWCCQPLIYILKTLSGCEDVMSSNCGRAFREACNYTVIKPAEHTTVSFASLCQLAPSQQ